EGSVANGAGAAFALGLAGASRQEADAFLREQRHLAKLQAEELAHDLKLRRWSLWVRHCSAILKLAFEFSIAIVLLGLVALIAGAVWNAAHDDGLVIEAFATPPDLAAKGLTGDVIAARLQDDLTALQAAANSVRAPSSMANNWGDDIKVEIPESGVSIGEASRYLHRALGRQTYIKGEVVEEAGKIAITARTNSDTAARAEGDAGNIDAVLGQLSESLF